MLIMMYAHNGGVFFQYSQRSLTRALQKFCVKHERYLTAEIAEKGATMTIIHTKLITERLDESDRRWF